MNTIKCNRRQVNINDFPEEILEKILIQTTTDLEGSMMAAAVCKRWRRIMVTRLSMVKYLLQDQWLDDDGNTENQDILIGIPKASYLFLYENGSHPNILSKCLGWLPNCMVVEVCRPDNLVDEEALLQLINSKTNIKGFFWYPNHNRRQGAAHAPLKLENVEMAAICSGEPFALTHTTLYYCCRQTLTQLYISNENLSPAAILPKFCNLRRLHMLYHDQEYILPRLLTYNGPVLENLEILELSLAVESMFDHVTHLLLFCPNLKSLFLRIESGHHNFDNSTSNRRFFENVENLVIEIGKSWVSHCKSDDWVCFMEIVRLFPNLENLGLRNVQNLSEVLILSALQWSFKLKLLDIKTQDEITTNKTTQLDTMSNLNAESLASCLFFRNRLKIDCSVTKYTNDYESETVQSGTWHVKEGFNFMAHIFPRDFAYSPVFLIDMDPQND